MDDLEDDRSKDLSPVKREMLKQRDYRVDLDSKLGKSVVITKATPSSQSGGYKYYISLFITHIVCKTFFMIKDYLSLWLLG